MNMQLVQDGGQIQTYTIKAVATFPLIVGPRMNIFSLSKWEIFVPTKLSRIVEASIPD